MFVLKVIEPTALDATKLQTEESDCTSYKLRMFSGRPHSIVQLLVLEDAYGTVRNQVAVRVTKSGQFKLDNLSDELTPDG